MPMRWQILSLQWLRLIDRCIRLRLYAARTSGRRHSLHPRAEHRASPPAALSRGRLLTKHDQKCPQSLDHVHASAPDTARRRLGQAESYRPATAAETEPQQARRQTLTPPNRQIRNQKKNARPPPGWKKCQALALTISNESRTTA